MTVRNKTIDVGELDVLCLVARAFGYENVDVDAGPYSTTIKFTTAGTPAAVSGKTLHDACEQFFSRIGLT